MHKLFETGADGTPDLTEAYQEFAVDEGRIASLHIHHEGQYGEEPIYLSFDGLSDHFKVSAGMARDLNRQDIQHTIDYRGADKLPKIVHLRTTASGESAGVSFNMTVAG
jgi:hypothetical protein